MGFWRHRARAPNITFSRRVSITFHVFFWFAFGCVFLCWVVDCVLESCVFFTSVGVGDEVLK